jgi:thiol-disulfide isomerase/thioredoxin
MLATRNHMGLGIVVVLVGILAAACSSGTDSAPTVLTAPAAAGSTVASAPDGPVATDFRLPLYSGGEFLDGVEEVSLSDLEGRPVIVNFWAPLCPPCRAEMPDFQELWEELQAIDSDAVVLGVDVGPFTGLGDRQQAIDFLETIELTYPTGQAINADIIRDYKVLGMPTTVFVHRNGTIMRTWTGAITGDKIREITQELIS